ncbi:MAG: peptidylprolyl isomerase [Polyangia bacterium]
MLEFFRQHVGGLVGIAIIGALVFVFALSFGTQSAGWGKGQSMHIEASVDGNEILESDLQYAIALAGGGQLAPESAEYEMLQRDVLRGLIERQLLLQLAENAGITASRDEAEKRIINDQVFLSVPVDRLASRLRRAYFIDEISAARVMLEDGYELRQSFLDEEGLFDIESFEKWVRYGLGITEEKFVEQQRLELTAHRVRQLLVAGIRVSDEEVRRAYERENDTVSLQYVRLIPEYFSARIRGEGEKLERWAEEHADRIEQHYETNKYRYVNVEKQARARHILLEVPEDATAEEKASRRAEIEALLKRARDGESFAELAREHSEDEQSAQRGGDLGWNPRGKMVPEFDEAMFSLSPGEISDVVETKYGFHIIELEGIREGNVSLEQATLEIAEQLYAEEAGRERARETAEQYLARLRDGEPIEKLPPEDAGAGHLAPRVRTTPLFSRNQTTIPGVGKAPNLVEAAFELTPDSPVPDRIFEIGNDFYVAQLAERNVPSDEEFEDQRLVLTEKLLALKQVSWLRDRIGELWRSAKDEGRLEASVIGEVPSRPPARKGPRGDLPAGPAGAAGGAAPEPFGEGEPVEADEQAPEEPPADEGEEDDPEDL